MTFNVHQVCAFLSKELKRGLSITEDFDDQESDPEVYVNALVHVRVGASHINVEQWDEKKRDVKIFPDRTTFEEMLQDVREALKANLSS